MINGPGSDVHRQISLSFLTPVSSVPAESKSESGLCIPSPPKSTLLFCQLLLALNYLYQSFLNHRAHNLIHHWPNVIPQKLSTSKIPMLFFLGTSTTIPLHENGTRHVSNIGWPTFTTSLPRFPCQPSRPLAQHWEIWAGGGPFSVGGVLRHLWE